MNKSITSNEFNQYQSLVERVNQSYNCGDNTLAIAALGLAGETGEVIEIIKKHIRDDQLDLDHLKEELGDVLAYIALLARIYNIDFDDVKSFNEEKLITRMNDRSWNNELH